MSRIALDETVLQLRKSRQRCDELRKRLEGLRSQSRAAPTESEDDLRKRMETKLGDERKTLRRMYSLMKKLSPSIHSECLLRAEEICSRNSTLVLDQEALERLMPFSNEPSVELIRSFVKYLFIVCLDSPTMWKYIRFPNQYMILLSRDIKDFTAEGMSCVRWYYYWCRSLHFPSSEKHVENGNKRVSEQNLQCTSYTGEYFEYARYHVIIYNDLGKGYRYSRSATLKEPDWKKAYVYIDPLFKPTSMTTKEAVEELKRN